MADQQQSGGATGGNKGDMDEIKKKIEEARVKENEEMKKVENGEMAKLEQEILALKLSNEEAQAKALRALADLHNARKRMEEEKATFAVFAAQSLVLKVLDIYENYHRLLEHKPEGVPEGEWLKGLELIDQQFQSFLELQGVKKIEVKAGDKVNPSHHEVVMAGEGEDGAILEVFSNGYEMQGRVIKTAKVKVGRKA